MAVRKPLYYDAGDLKEMTTAMVDTIIKQCVYQYSLDTSVTLSVLSSGGNLGSITDTRQQAGTMLTHASTFPNEATTPEPTTVTVTYDKIHQTISGGSPTSDSGYLWPAYNTNENQTQAMSLQDVKDTFLHPAINLLTSSSLTTSQAGTYHINSSSSVSGSTRVSATPVFINTQADTSAYSAGDIPEDLDQPTTVTSYYLYKINGNNNSMNVPLYIRSSDNNLQNYTEANFKTYLKEWMKKTAADSSDGFKIAYSYTTGTNRGSGMADTILSGTGDYQTFQAGGDDYRAQEFPNGTPSTANTYYLKIRKL